MTDSTLEHVRLFVACEVPDDVKDTIGEVIEGLRQKSGTAVRWIKPDGVHVTLKFLGEVPTKKLPAVKLAIQEAVVAQAVSKAQAASVRRRENAGVLNEAGVAGVAGVACLVSIGRP